MTSEVEERPRLVMGGYGRHRRQWVKDLILIKDPILNTLAAQGASQWQIQTF